MKELGDSSNVLVKMPEDAEGQNNSPVELSPDTELLPWQREVKGMYDAIGHVHEKAKEPNAGFNGQDVLVINKKVMNDPFNPHLYGVLRRATVSVGSTIKGEYRKAAFVPPHPSQLPGVFENFSQELEEKTSRINSQSAVSDVVDTASWAHEEIIKIHPFVDGNGRTARLVVDLIFKRANLPYITDWGAQNDEYKDVVDRVYRENNPNLFKQFLGNKLLKRCQEIGLSDVDVYGGETSSYLGALKLNAA